MGAILTSGQLRIDQGNAEHRHIGTSGTSRGLVNSVDGQMLIVVELSTQGQEHNVAGLICLELCHWPIWSPSAAGLAVLAYYSSKMVLGSGRLMRL